MQKRNIFIGITLTMSLLGLAACSSEEAPATSDEKTTQEVVVEQVDTEAPDAVAGDVAEDDGVVVQVTYFDFDHDVDMSEYTYYQQAYAYLFELEEDQIREEMGENWTKGSDNLAKFLCYYAEHTAGFLGVDTNEYDPIEFMVDASKYFEIEASYDEAGNRTDNFEAIVDILNDEELELVQKYNIQGVTFVDVENFYVYSEDSSMILLYFTFGMFDDVDFEDLLTEAEEAGMTLTDYVASSGMNPFEDMGFDGSFFIEEGVELELPADEAELAEAETEEDVAIVAE